MELIGQLKKIYKIFRFNSIFCRIFIAVFSGVLLIVILAVLLYYNNTYNNAKIDREQIMHSYIESVSASASLILSDNLAREINNLANSYLSTGVDLLQ
ncbi:MAG: hypothetical protein LBL96_10685 [Clostridiales bacterium]|jgi:hypothetical protein|nr:hypothetical protein [Clostridiales bacterium]